MSRLKQYYVAAPTAACVRCSNEEGDVTGLFALWIPILLSAVLVFFASAIIHMAPLWHKNDYPRVPNEDRALEALRPLAIPPGDYMLPRAYGNAEMQSAGFLEKVRKGPVMILTVMPNAIPSMGRSLTLWFINCVVVSIFSAYIAGRALPPGIDYLRVFQLAGATAFIGYSVALWQMSIWFARSWRHSIVETVDGLIYSLLTAGVFGWLWPR
jgi:hypothetical protein